MKTPKEFLNEASYQKNETFTILKKGRKYFSCLLNNKYKCDLVINDVSKDFEPNQTVSLLVSDISVSSKYGTKLKFDPVSNADPNAERKAKEKRKFIQYLEYAERDANQGSYATNAIKDTLNDAENYPELADRIYTLKLSVSKNISYWEDIKKKREEEKKIARQKRAEEKTKRILFAIANLPPVNIPFRLFKNPNFDIVITGFGQKFKISEDHPSVFGHHLLGHEGDYGCYGYYRLATDEEKKQITGKEWK